jgi:hypothetical protein
MTVYEIYKNVINNGDFVLSAMEEKIETVYAQGKITAEERTDLLNLASNMAKPEKQIDIVLKLAELEKRIAAIEGTGIVVWTSGMSVAKGQTILYDVLKEGQMRYCRYDGGRAATSLSPGKIDGWVVLASANGEVTHKIVRVDGVNTLVPVNE